MAEINGMWVHQANCTSARGILADLAGDRDTAVETAQADRGVADPLAG